MTLFDRISFIFADFMQYGLLIVMGFLLLVVPFVCIYNFIGLFHRFKIKWFRNIMWAITLIAGVIDTILYMELFEDISLESVWDVQLYNDQVHQPIWTGSWVTLAVIGIIGIIGAVVLIVTDVNKVPPLVTVISMAAVYLLLGEVIMWCIQLANHILSDAIMCYVLPANIFMIAVNLFMEKIRQWNENEVHASENFGKDGLIKGLNMSLKKAENWPIYAFLFMVPLFGIVLVILVLFGQEPDAVIKAWTETTEWTLSQQVGPQNLYYDEHYLCTVAAGGHRKVVKPVRRGIRHGHEVIVNRQLMIANAFENVLEEKTPRFHRALRDFYDKYGFPIADYIRTNKVACDITYFVMKPLEWIFLIVLYLVDVNPENRIAVQYLPNMK
ncbi:MAG: hypothetical protein IJV29_17815 [Butyrivibrio sp.]|nr:hypothetical protein [Butyrivibrio sp.]